MYTLPYVTPKKWNKALYSKTSCKPLVCKPYKAKLCMAAKHSFANLRVPKQSFGSQTEGYQSKALVRKSTCKNRVFARKTPRRRRQNFVQNFVLQALQSKALYGGKTSCKTTFCKPYKAKLCKAFASHTKLTKLTKLRVQKLCFCKYKLCTSFVRRLQAVQSKALYGVCDPRSNLPED